MCSSDRHGLPPLPLASPSPPPTPGADAFPFRELVDFHLLHEFTEGGHFDRHVATKPSDSSDRTLPLNAMLSVPGNAFSLGELMVHRPARPPTDQRAAASPTGRRVDRQRSRRPRVPQSC